MPLAWEPDTTRDAIRRREQMRNDMDVALKHQLRIARDTMRMTDVMARIMGGMDRATARELLLSKGTARDRKLVATEDAYDASRERAS